MKLFPRFEPDDSGIKRLFVRYRAHGDDMIGDGSFVVSPGDTVVGLTYDEWKIAAIDGRIIEFD